MSGAEVKEIRLRSYLIEEMMREPRRYPAHEEPA
jgi:hypothetical protein